MPTLKKQFGTDYTYFLQKDPSIDRQNDNVRLVFQQLSPDKNIELIDAGPFLMVVDACSSKVVTAHLISGFHDLSDLPGVKSEPETPVIPPPRN